MHGNTFSTNSIKTRDVNDIQTEISEVKTLLESCGESLQGLHLETSYEDVTECLGGQLQTIKEEDLSKNYKSFCDPRLNYL